MARGWQFQFQGVLEDALSFQCVEAPANMLAPLTFGEDSHQKVPWLPQTS